MRVSFSSTTADKIMLSVNRQRDINHQTDDKRRDKSAFGIFSSPFSLTVVSKSTFLLKSFSLFSSDINVGESLRTHRFVQRARSRKEFVKMRPPCARKIQISRRANRNSAELSDKRRALIGNFAGQFALDLFDWFFGIRVIIDENKLSPNCSAARRICSSCVAANIFSNVSPCDSLIFSARSLKDFLSNAARFFPFGQRRQCASARL
jgi:hypothetical protein